MRKIPGYVIFIVIVLLIFVVTLFTFGYVNLSAKIDRQAPTGVQVIPYPLMDGGGDTTSAGAVTGCVSVVRSTQSAGKSEWQLVIEKWPVFQKYTGPALYYDRSAANHEKVTWDVADITFLQIDEDNAVLLYLLDGQEYIAWSTSHTVAPCYGATDKWWFGGL